MCFIFAKKVDPLFAVYWIARGDEGDFHCVDVLNAKFWNVLLKKMMNKTISWTFIKIAEPHSKLMNVHLYAELNVKGVKIEVSEYIKSNAIIASGTMP